MPWRLPSHTDFRIKWLQNQPTHNDRSSDVTTSCTTSRRTGRETIMWPHDGMHDRSWGRTTGRSTSRTTDSASVTQDYARPPASGTRTTVVRPFNTCVWLSATFDCCNGYFEYVRRPFRDWFWSWDCPRSLRLVARFFLACLRLSCWPGRTCRNVDAWQMWLSP